MRTFRDHKNTEIKFVRKQRLIAEDVKHKDCFGVDR